MSLIWQYENQHGGTLYEFTIWKKYVPRFNGKLFIFKYDTLWNNTNLWLLQQWSWNVKWVKRKLVDNILQMFELSLYLILLASLQNSDPALSCDVCFLAMHWTGWWVIQTWILAEQTNTELYIEKFKILSLATLRCADKQLALLESLRYAALFEMQINVLKKYFVSYSKKWVWTGSTVSHFQEPRQQIIFYGITCHHHCCLPLNAVD